MRIGLISDTHGLLRPPVLQFLEGCDRILHAGDIGSPYILDALASVAPIVAVRGNNDHGPWADALREIEQVSVPDCDIFLIHDLAQLKLPALAPSVRVVVSGHSHKPHCYENEGITYINPGSAGPRRFTLPIAVAELHVDGAGIAVRHHLFDA